MAKYKQIRIRSNGLAICYLLIVRHIEDYLERFEVAEQQTFKLLIFLKEF